MSLHKLTRRDYASVTALVTASAAALLIVSGSLLPGSARAQSLDASDWGFYGGDAFGQHYSSLDQIKRENVDSLTVAWTYRTVSSAKDSHVARNSPSRRRPCSRSDSYT